MIGFVFANGEGGMKGLLRAAAKEGGAAEFALLLD